MIDLDARLQRGTFELEVKLHSCAPTLALFGPSGSGKTTLLMAVAGLLKPDAGRIALDGRTLFDSSVGLDLPPAQRSLGVVFQDLRMFPHLSVRDNLNYGLRYRHAGATLVDFDAVVELLGLATLLSRRPSSLSGGESRRVVLGRALLARPAALLLDEPLTGLHRQARVEVLEYLRAIKCKLRVPMLLVSHEADEVMALADSIGMIEDGRIVEHVDLDTFRTRHRRRDALQLMPVDATGESAP